MSGQENTPLHEPETLSHRIDHRGATVTVARYREGRRLILTQ